jgi:hypothetical protein
VIQLYVAQCFVSGYYIVNVTSHWRYLPLVLTLKHLKCYPNICIYCVIPTTNWYFSPTVLQICICIGKTNFHAQYAVNCFVSGLYFDIIRLQNLQLILRFSSSDQSKLHWWISWGLWHDVMTRVWLKVQAHVFFTSALFWRLQPNNIKTITYTVIQLCLPFHMAVCDNIRRRYVLTSWAQHLVLRPTEG